MKPKRHKVQCCECNAVFNNDYRTTHEKCIHNGKRVAIKTIGAPANPFEAASFLKKRKADNLVDVDEIEPKQGKYGELLSENDNPFSSIQPIPHSAISELLDNPKDVAIRPILKPAVGEILELDEAEIALSCTSPILRKARY